MKFVQPIRDPEIIEGIMDYLLHKNVRDYIFFSLGIYSGLRVDDLLNLRVHMVRNRTHIALTEGKTKKNKQFIIHPDLKPVLDEYIMDMKDSDYLFPSRQKKTKSGIKGKPIHRTTAYKMLNKVAEKFGLSEIGCHTLRKTWGYHLYIQNPENLALLMEMFNHSKQTITLRYLGLTQDAMDRAITRLSYSKKRVK
ncbi:tyrosine-type recombinase/integrase [Paenibacillus aquistagni]|uniref:tyrosine-type recombinase/integrase n=1 Tax=Paenibacillus aquistagni TaxID=1852522 RepID=UPI00145A2892|nr:tyrosine-type recombinase/integrase [Paenibacillus aquistagni]NMM52140.1 tyrosine-type recombinase/integrase [Paenibacillus aquistagni]